MKLTKLGSKIYYHIVITAAIATISAFGICRLVDSSLVKILVVFLAFSFVTFQFLKIIQKYISIPIEKISQIMNEAQNNNSIPDKIDMAENTEIYELCNGTLSIMNKIKDISHKVNVNKINVLKTINEISSAMIARRDLNEVLRLIIDLATKILEAKYSSLMLITEETNELLIKVSNGLSDELINKIRIKVGHGIAGTVAYEGKPYLSTDIENDPRFKKSSNNPRFENKSFICVPVKLGNKVIGVLSINDKQTGSAFDGEDLELATIFANQAAISIENSKLYEQAEKKVEELETIFNATKVISSILDVGMLLKQVLETCVHIVSAKAGMIMLLNEDSLQYEIKTYHGMIDTRCAYEFRLDKNSEVCEILTKSLSASLFQNIDENIDFADLTNYLKFRIKQIICVPLHTKQKLTGIMVILSDVSQNDFSANDLNILTALSTQAAIVIENAKLYESIKTQFISTIRVATNALEFKDAYTSGHSERVTEYAVALAQELNLPYDEIELIRQAAILHDIGKIGISETILTKKGRLTDEEFATIKLHPSIGDSIVEPMAIPPQVRAGIRNHHEKWDGRGYPDGLAGEQIPLTARIIAIADSYDAMTSNRPYRDAMGMEKVYNEFIRCAGTQFDPHLADVFVKMLRRNNATSIGDKKDTNSEPIENKTDSGNETAPPKPPQSESTKS